MRRFQNFPIKYIVDFVGNNLKQYDDYVEIFNEAIKRGLNKRHSEEWAILAINDYLLKHKNYHLINILCEDIIKRGFEKDMGGRLYYAWAFYFLKENNLNECINKLKIASERGYNKIFFYQVDNELKQFIGKDLLYEILKVQTEDSGIGQTFLLEKDELILSKVLKERYPSIELCNSDTYISGTKI